MPGLSDDELQEPEYVNKNSVIIIIDLHVKYIITCTYNDFLRVYIMLLSLKLEINIGYTPYIERFSGMKSSANKRMATERT